MAFESETTNSSLFVQSISNISAEREPQDQQKKQQQRHYYLQPDSPPTMPSLANMKSTKDKTPQTSDQIAKAGRQIAREADLLRNPSLGDRNEPTGHRKTPRPPGRGGSRTSQTRAMAASSREAKDGMASRTTVLEESNKNKTGRLTHAGAIPTDQEATYTETSTAMATEEENQARMRTRFTTKTRKQSNDPEDKEGAAKKRG